MPNCALKSWTSFCFMALILIITGCESKSPEEKIAETRALYSVTLEGFSIDELSEENPEPKPAEEGASVSSEAIGAATIAEEAVEGEVAEEEMEGEVEETGPRSTDVLLNLLVRFKGEEPLPGITVDISQSDQNGEEKTTSLQWIPTSDIGSNETKQVDLNLEGVEFEDGDTFSVLLRTMVPPEERGGYREFSEAGE